MKGAQHTQCTQMQVSFYCCISCQADGSCVLAMDTGIRGLTHESVCDIVFCVCLWLMSSSDQFRVSCSMTCVSCAIFSLEDSHFVWQLALKFGPLSILSFPQRLQRNKDEWCCLVTMRRCCPVGILEGPTIENKGKFRLQNWNALKVPGAF